MNRPCATDEAFRAELVPIIPHMRAFARSLTGDATSADDLAQEALAKAWCGRASYAPGTNMKAWVFMILRNQFYSDKRRSWRQMPLDMEVAENTLIATSNPSGAIELDELRRAMSTLPDEHREALILVGIAGLPYEEAAMICGCPVGTIKSRVCRARARLAELLDSGFIPADDLPCDGAIDRLIEASQRLQMRAAA
jgi:RNA polymerase sigma-70 factor (ECF subfamily)